MHPDSIDRLDVGFVPHRHWALRKWFYANPLWYYHRRRTDEEIRADRRFYSLVDPCLREVCHLLLEHGLQTTPSCQGHFYGQERFEQVWEELLRERSQIVADGLEVRDSETDDRYRFHDTRFTLPWERFETFYVQARQQQCVGYLGVLIPFDRGGFCESLCRRERGVEISFDDEVGQCLGAHLLSITTQPTTPEERDEMWRRITADVDEVLHMVPAAR